MSKILCSTGALIGKPNGRDFRLLAPLSEKLHCDGFEFMMYNSWYDSAEEIAGYLREMKFDIPVMHCEKHIGEKISQNGPGDWAEALRLFDINCQMAENIHAGKLVLHLWDGMTSDANFANNQKAYGEFVGIADNYGIDLLVENVVCNQENPMKHWCELAERYPDIHFVFDTKMAAFHQELELLYDKEYRWLWEKNHIRHYHVNDYGGGYKEWGKLRTLPIGEGHIDFKKFFDFVRRTGYNGTFTVEATAFDKEGKVDLDMLNRCFDYIRREVAPSCQE
ncbi:MAG: sugar phosphate isomerase/epimerase [Lachnospiraceae bacterium]|nr:sugar phosphate isomerase/epimerase [Lachnospiraceae bacterium]